MTTPNKKPDTTVEVLETDDQVAAPLAVSFHGLAGAGLEPGQVAMIVAEQQKLQLAVHHAMTFRGVRDRDSAFAMMAECCELPEFAEDAEYRFDVAGTEIHGPTVIFCREYARAAGHIRSGYRTLSETPTDWVIQGWAWDLITGRYEEFEQRVPKLIQLSSGWKPCSDPRQEMLVYRLNGGKLERNALKGVIPYNDRERLLKLARSTKAGNVTEDPDRYIQKLIVLYQRLGIQKSALDQYAGGDLRKLNAEKLVELMDLYQALRSAEITWFEVLQGKAPRTEPAKPAPADAASDKSVDDAVGPDDDDAPPIGDEEPDVTDDPTFPISSAELAKIKDHVSRNVTDLRDIATVMERIDALLTGSDETKKLLGDEGCPALASLPRSIADWFWTALDAILQDVTGQEPKR